MNRPLVCHRGAPPPLGFAVLLLACWLAVLGGCTAAPQMHGKIVGLQKTVDDAEKNGAMKCAPRELAVARSNLEFAEIDLDQGFLSAAQAHMAKAEPNAQAAFEMSPPDRCTAREFVEVAEAKPVDKDTDGDTIVDSRDQCILEPEDMDGYLDDDGCPDPDNDADTIPDTADKCPMQPEDFDGWQDDDGCPDPDNDADQVADLDDFCPNTPGVPGGDHPGCPKKNSLIVVTEHEIRILQQIQFEFNKAVVKPGISFKILDEVDGVLNDNMKISLEVQGHTDNVGGDAYNMNLSQKRADAVKAYMVAHGISPTRLVSKGYGFHQPLVPNDTAANRQLNRRSQFIRTESGPATPSP
jgi:OOP family OmpA-OmpF porin